MKPNAIIMHPAPINRGVEIDSDLVECETFKNFQTNGKWCICKNGCIKKCTYNNSKGEFHMKTVIKNGQLLDNNKNSNK